MGVYVFRCRHGPFVKVGHHLVTRGRPNAYYRVAGRGFETVVHPPELDGLLYPEHLTLEGWYPTLAREHETAVHRRFRTAASVGEFHPDEHLAAILASLDAFGGRAEVGEAARRRAMRWGARQVRRALRRRARGGGAGVRR